MLSIDEICQKTIEQRKRIRIAMDGFGYYHPDINVRNEGTASLTDGLRPADAKAVMESLRAIPLREFLAKSGTAGISGAAYLVPAKAHDLALFYSAETDKVPLISRQVIQDWKGDEWTLSVADDAAYTPYPFSSGGHLPDMSANFTQVSMQFDQDRTLGIAVTVGADLLDDVPDYDVLEWHLQQAAVAMGREATDRALAVLVAAGDGVGTLNTEGGSADETTPDDIYNAIDANGVDHFVSDTLVTTTEAWGHTLVYQGAAAEGHTVTVVPKPLAEGFDVKFDILDTLLSTSDELYTLASGAMTDCISMVFDRRNALVTGRKRWLRLERYAQPTEDLVGAVIVGAQDSVTLYKDAICKVTET